MKIKAALSAQPRRAVRDRRGRARRAAARTRCSSRCSAVGICHSDLTMKSGLAGGDLADRARARGRRRGRGRRRRRHRDVARRRPRPAQLPQLRLLPRVRRAAIQPYCRDFRSLNGIGTRPDGSMTMRRDGSAGLRLLLRPVELRLARARLRVERCGHRPRRSTSTIAAPLGLRRADRRRHHPQRAEARRGGVAGRVRRRSRRALGGDGRALPSASTRSSPSIRSRPPPRSPASSAPSATIDPGARRRGWRDPRADRRRRHARDRHQRQGRGHQPGDRGARPARDAGAARASAFRSSRWTSASVISGGKTVRGVIEGDAVPRRVHPALDRAAPRWAAAAGEADPHLRIRCRSTPRSPTRRAVQSIKPVLNFDLNSV